MEDKTLYTIDTKAKYLVLANAMFWRHPESGFELSWTSQTTTHTLRDLDPKSLKAEPDEATVPDPKEGNWWVKVKDIPNDKDLVQLITTGLHTGLLELTDDYAQWLIDKQNKKADNKKTRKGLIWTETDLDQVKKRRQIPRNPSIARGTMTYSDKDSKAYILLQETAKDLKSLLPKVVGALNKKDQASFLKEALSIEKNGYNRAMTPRASVVELILDLMGSLGIASGIGIVTSKQEPIAKDLKPLKLV